MRPIRGLKTAKDLKCWMAKISKICIFITGIIISLFSLLPSLKQTPVTSPAQPPQRFFPAGSAVLDFPFGNMNPIVDLLQKEEILFVMYYAPWCAQSIVVREEYQKAAKYMLEKVKFVGVNCWWPEGSCKNTFKFLKYPELYVYHTNLDGFRFNGIPTADELVKFIEDILYPITFLHNIEGINNFTAVHDNIAIGNFDLTTPTPPGLKTYYVSAMRMIEWNHLQPVKFCIVNKPELSELLGMNDTKQFILLNMNGSSIYPLQNNFTSESIIKWINQHRYENLVKWISIPGHKSLQLSMHLERGPNLLVFAPINRLHAVNFYILVMREVILKYRNCNNKTFILVIENLIKRQRQQAVESMVLSKDCLPPLVKNSSCCMTLYRQKHICELCNRKFDSKTSDICEKISADDIPNGVFQNFQPPSCLDSYQNYNINEYRTLTCKQCLSSHSCGIRHSSDPYVNKVVNDFPKSKCKRLSLQKSLYLDSEQRIYNSDIVREPIVEEFTGFKCRTNKTVNVVVLDKSKHQAFLDRLGTYLPTETNSSVSVIIDKKNEVQYLLRQPFSKHNIANFIMNFTRGDLPRHMRSEVISTSCATDVCVSDATSSTFHSIVMDENKFTKTVQHWTPVTTVPLVLTKFIQTCVKGRGVKYRMKCMSEGCSVYKDVMMLVYNQWCGFCASVAHIYLSLARYFKSAKHIVFSRINNDDNDLPWQYTIDKYPTVLFFPAHRKAESVKFPETVALNLPNFIKFVLNHATHDLRMDTAIDVCSKSCIQNNLRKVSETLVFNIKRRQLIEKRIEKLQWQYQKKQMSVRFKSAITVLSKRLKEIDRRYRNAFILLKYLKSSKLILDKNQLKNVLESKNNIKIDNPAESAVVRNDGHDEL